MAGIARELTACNSAKNCWPPKQNNVEFSSLGHILSVSNAHSVELGIILNAHCIRILDTYNSIRVLVDRFTELQLAAHCCQLHYAIRQFFSPTPLWKNKTLEFYRAHQVSSAWENSHLNLKVRSHIRSFGDIPTERCEHLSAMLFKKRPLHAKYPTSIRMRQIWDPVMISTILHRHGPRPQRTSCFVML